jgi:hypothetical protein
MHLGVFVLGAGNHSAGWRWEGAAVSNNDLAVIQAATGLEGLITPTELHYTVQHFAAPPVIETRDWGLGLRRGQEFFDP